MGGPGVTEGVSRGALWDPSLSSFFFLLRPDSQFFSASLQPRNKGVD